MLIASYSMWNYCSEPWNYWHYLHRVHPALATASMPLHNFLLCGYLTLHRASQQHKAYHRAIVLHNILVTLTLGLQIFIHFSASWFSAWQFQDDLYFSLGIYRKIFCCWGNEPEDRIVLVGCCIIFAALGCFVCDSELSWLLKLHD